MVDEAARSTVFVSRVAWRSASSPTSDTWGLTSGCEEVGL